MLYFVQSEMAERKRTMGYRTSDKDKTIKYFAAQCDDNPTVRIRKAMDMAQHYHEGQTRLGRDGMASYYEEHVLGVYNILRQECNVQDEDVLIIALLHDTVEDTECTLDDIENEFGPDIREEVRLLTRIDGEPFSVYSGRLFANASYRTVLVKLADRLHNIRNITCMPNIRWIQKKVDQSYTDILEPLPAAVARIDDHYNDVIYMLAHMIEDQLRKVQDFLDQKYSMSK